MQNLQLKLGNETYIVSYPNVRQKIEIETMKMFLSQNQYGALAVSGHKTAARLLDLIDAVSYFSVLIPEIGKPMTVAMFEDMGIESQFLYINAYKKVFWPWYEKIEKEINNLNDIEDDSSDQPNNEIE